MEIRNRKFYRSLQNNKVLLQVQTSAKEYISIHNISASDSFSTTALYKYIYLLTYLTLNLYALHNTEIKLFTKTVCIIKLSASKQ